jgi:hypothetical protein
MGGKPRILIVLQVRAAMKNFRQQQQLRDRDLDMQMVQDMLMLLDMLVLLILPGCNGGK